MSNMMPMSKTVQHAGMAGNVLLCDRCGARQELTLPQPMDSVAALMKAWGKAHAKCKGNRVAFREATELDEWPISDDTGMSSKAIYRHMRGGVTGDFPYPLDPDDFGRCYRLLLLAPEWRLRISEMAQHGKGWAALSSAWDELTALYEEESPRGTAPKLYARMKELLAAPPTEMKAASPAPSHTTGEPGA